MIAEPNAMNASSRLFMNNPVAVLLVSALLVAAGCGLGDKLGLARVAIPDMGPPLPVSVTLAFDPSVTSAKYTYMDGCNHPNIPVFLGRVLESALTDAADQTFKTVKIAGAKPGEVKSDLDIQIVLQQQGFNIQTDNLYDRVPAELLLEAVAIFRDPSGKVLREVPLKVMHRDKLFLEVSQQRCAYATMDKFASDASAKLATLFAQASRDLLDPTRAAAGGPSTATAAPGLAFKATILDENGNLVLEGGERIKVRVDLTNSGKVPVTGVTATISGTPALVSSFPSTTLQVGGLQPGDSRSVEFVATLPQSVDAPKAELVVAVGVESGSSAPAAQNLVADMRGAGGARFDTVDQVPQPIAGFQRPHTFVIAVGISTYRDQQNATRKFGSVDAELIAAYFRALGGIPAANVRVLQDAKALRPDLEEALMDWLPSRVTADSLVIVYFAGQAVVNPTGDISLVPYDGKPSSPGRLLPLKDVHIALAELKAKQVLFIFDGTISKVGKTSKSKSPQWGAGGGTTVRMISTSGIRASLEPDKLRHGLFTYYVLRGLKGEADLNFDGNVTIGELATFVGRTVPTAAKQDFNQEQRPLVIPALSPTNKARNVTLTRATTGMPSSSR